MTDDRTDAERLNDALTDGALAVASVVGLPSHDAREDRIRLHCDLVDRDRVPELAWKAACMAVDYLTVAMGVLADGAAISVEDGLAAMTRKDPPPC